MDTETIARYVLRRYVHLHSWGVSRQEIAATLHLDAAALDGLLRRAGLDVEPRLIGVGS